VTAFPSPSRIRSAEDTEWLERNTNYFFSNLEREFGKQAKKNSVNQTIRLGENTKRTPGALWAQNFSPDGVSVRSDQVQHGIAVANERLSGTGWRVVDIQPVQLLDNSYGHYGWPKTRWPTRVVLDVVMEYVCDDVCAAK